MDIIIMEYFMQIWLIKTMPSNALAPYIIYIYDNLLS